MTRLLGLSMVLTLFFVPSATCLDIGDDFLGTWYGVFRAKDEGNIYDVVFTILRHDGKQMNGIFAFTDKIDQTILGNLKGIWIVSQSDALGWGLSLSGRSQNCDSKCETSFELWTGLISPEDPFRISGVLRISCPDEGHVRFGSIELRRNK
jgi:hypothetical protein